MRPLLGKPVVVENRAGALGNIATEYTAKSKPDGHTIYLAAPSTLAANQHLLKNPSVDIINELRIVATINKQPLMVAVHTTSPYKTLADLTAAMKAKGDKASYAYASPSAKVVGALYNQKAGLQAADVAYRTGADYFNDLASGQIDFAIPDNVTAVTQEKAGRMRILAVSTGERLQAAPQLPTMTELGYPMNLVSWWAAMVPAATPAPILNQLNIWFSQVVSGPEARNFLNGIASDPWINKPDDAQAFWREEIKNWAEYVKLAKIEPQG
jgi:tripartite-type tricarboxylate transporter receptor subunit TctC